ncbi:hypothetical protein E2C01_078436 [Portunus trituberculatus]|uniref:Uncharacterized protein n=1 Tax=Portunus trituberculatus TaxID=210409 RepID=A0A5B7IGY8_PORTR|nr:hypothetical protein [Portunus trituberculatus]
MTSFPKQLILSLPRYHACCRHAPPLSPALVIYNLHERGLRGQRGAEDNEHVTALIFLFLQHSVRIQE